MNITIKNLQEIKRRMLKDIGDRVSDGFCTELLNQLSKLDEFKRSSPSGDRLANIREKDIADSYVQAAKIVSSVIYDIGKEYGL